MDIVFDSTTYGVNGKKITHIAFLAKGEVMEIALRNASYASGLTYPKIGKLPGFRPLYFQEGPF